MNGLPTQFFATLVAKQMRKLLLAMTSLISAKGILTALRLRISCHPYKKLLLIRCIINIRPSADFHFLKQAIAQRYKEDHNVDLDPDTEVAILFGGKTGLIEIAQCLLIQAMYVWFLIPGYPDYWSGVALAGAEMAFMPLREENNFLPDYSQLKQSDLDRAKLMFINYPNNPTGATAPASFYEETVAFAEQEWCRRCK